MPPEETQYVLPELKFCERAPNSKWVTHSEATHLMRRECPYCGNYQILSICKACVKEIESHHEKDARWNCIKCHRKLHTSALQVMGRV